MNPTTNQPSNKYINRELSWLEFNQRVLDQSLLPETPLLERLKFLAISGSNLDEFYRVRVGGLMIQQRSNPEHRGIAGLTPEQQLARIRQRIRKMHEDQYRCLNETILPRLAEHGILRLTPKQLTSDQRNHLHRLFEEEVFSVLAPIAVSSQKDFPLMIGSSMGMCFRLSGPQLQTATKTEETESTHRFVVIPLGRTIPRMVSVPAAQGYQFVLLEDAVAMFADEYFPGQTVHECVAFRTDRNAQIQLDEDAVADLLADMREMIDERKTNACVRLEISGEASDQTRLFLQNCLGVDNENTYVLPGPLDLAAFMTLAMMPSQADLKFEPWPSQPSPDFNPTDDIFEVIRMSDRLLMHPYQTYDPVVDFIQTAARDANVIAIKQTLYRTSQNSKMVEALRHAAESGKHVTAVVELKARFDEQRNIGWAEQLEKSGVDVIYGVRGMKTHAKLCLVVRREASGLQRYLHVGTGNYNESTARIYSDVSLFSADSQLCQDAVNLFNAITGQSIPQKMNKLVAAPINLRNRFIELIEVEIANAENGRAAMISAKVNSLFDKKIIDALYQASQAGVKIRLNVRGICCLRPGIEGLSENIYVTSIVDRFLEHARMFYFLHGGDHQVFIASADWMGRNLDRRVELMVPIENSQCKNRVIDALNSNLKDNVKGQQLLPDGSYELNEIADRLPHRSQQHLYTIACELHHAQSNQTRTIFQPHRSENETA